MVSKDSNTFPVVSWASSWATSPVRLNPTAPSWNFTGNSLSKPVLSDSPKPVLEPVKPAPTLNKTQAEVNVWGFPVESTLSPKPELPMWGSSVPYSKTRKSIFDTPPSPASEPTPPTPTPDDNPWKVGTPTKRRKGRTFSPEPANVQMAPLNTSMSGSSSSGFSGLFRETESPATLTGAATEVTGRDPWDFWGARRGSVSRVTPRKTL